MESSGYFSSTPRCVLCMTCANGIADDHGRPGGCSAGLMQQGGRFECESFVRRFTRGGLPGAAASPAPNTR